jgi:outer membrane receptor protein involved in Fe transport
MLDSSTELATTAYIRSSGRKTYGGDAEREAEWNTSAATPPDFSDAPFYDYETSQVINRTTTSQTSYGASTNLTKVLEAHQLTTGASIDAAAVSYGATQAICNSLSSARQPLGCGSAEDEARVKGKSYALGVYASDTWTIREGTFLTAAARFNHARVSNTLTTWDGGVADEKPRESFNYSSFNPSVGLSHRLSGELTVFGNVGQSNRVPTVIELGCADPTEPCRLPTGLQADPYLKQVIAQTIEAGWRWAPSSDTGLNVSVYRSDNRDDILFRAANVSGLGYFANFPRTRRQGLDLSGYQVLGPLTLRAGYSYLHATYQATETLFGGERSINVAPGSRIAGLPEHTFKLNADWRAAPKFVVGGTVMATTNLVSQGNEDGYVGADTVNKVKANANVKGYTLFHLHATYEAEKGLEYFARVNNVFDTRFESYGLMAMSMFNSAGIPITGDDGPNVSRFVAPGAPRNFMVGLRYRF